MFTCRRFQHVCRNPKFLKSLNPKVLYRVDKKGENAFTQAVRAGDEKITRLFSTSVLRFRPNYRGGENQTNIIWSSVHGHADVIKALGDAGVYLDAQDRYGNTPAIFAASLGHANVIKVLCDAGIDLNTI
jgi:ankyrin repeat protein